MSKQIVFIDSRVPDIQDLLNGLNSDEQAFVINGHSDGLDQIVALLEANHLTDLSSISIVGHGASGEIDLGSTVIDDANLAGDAAALSIIGAAIAPGGNLALFACDTAAGPAGQTFISDLSAFAGGVDVTAATHLVGSADLGASWTLDASTAAPAAPAAVPFTNQALAGFHGTLGALTVTAGATTIYHGGAAAQPLDATLTVTDFSSATLVGASVQILNFASGDTLNFTDQNNIHGSYNVNTGLLTLSGNDTAADYQAALRSVTYSFAGNGDPTAGGHQATYVSWQVSDGNPADVAPAPINTDQRTLGLNQLVVLNGTFPANDGNFGTTDGGGIPLGAIRTFAGDSAWGGTAAADGQILSIQQNTPLFAVLGTNYGGNGTNNFALPNLQGQIAVGFEQNSSTGAFLGQAAGSDTVTLTHQNLPTNWGGSDQPVNNDQPSLSLNYIINTAGTIPGAGGSSVDVVGEIVPFLGQYAPAGYLFANGQLLASSQYSNLYDALGTTYGGDGTTFALPDLTGKTIIGAGTSSVSGTQVTIGTTSGQDSTAIVTQNLPSPQGGSVPISNQQPSLALTYLIDPFGIFPSSSGTPVADTADIGEIIAFAGTGAALDNMINAGWMVANGTTLAIAQYQALFSVIGTTYGGNGTTNFVLPDLVGHSVAGVGSSNGVSVTLGQNYGTANIALAPSQVPLTTSTLDIVHTAPTVVAGATVAFAAGGAAVPLDSTLTVNDVDSGGNLTGATIAIGGFVAGDTLHFTNQNGIGGSYDPVHGVLTLSGSDTLGHYQTALESITFGTTDGNPGSRTIDWSVTDGATSNGTSATATSTVNVAPTISSVAAATPGNATDLAAGKVVTITVNFTGPVNVTGAPELQLNDNEVATYVSGSGSDALTFKYIVLPNDTTADLQVQSLLTNGGTIKDGNGNDAGLANAATDLHLQVDTTAPTVSSIVAAGSSPNTGGNEQFTVSFSESVTGVDSSDFTAVTSGTTDTGVVVTPVSGSVYTVTVEGVGGHGTLGLDLKASGTGIADLAGNAITGGFTGGSYTIAGPPLDNVMSHPTLTLTLDRGADPDNASYYATGVAGLPGGGSAVAWGESGNAKIEFLSFTGTVTHTVTLSDSQFSGSGYLAPLSDGDVVLTYNGSPDGNTYFSIISPTGVAVGPTEVTAGADILQAAQLSNGDIEMLTRVGSNGHSFLSTYDTTGAAVGSPVQISIALPAIQPFSIAANDLGSFIVTYATTTAYAAIYDNGGTSPTHTISLGALGNASATPAEAIALSDGDFAVLTNTPTSNILQIYAPDGSTVGNAVSLPTISDAILTADLTPTAPGLIIFSDHNEDGNIYAVRFDNSGNIVAGGTQTSQGVGLSLENSGNGVEVYSGNVYLQAAAAGHSAGAIGLFGPLSGTAPVIETFELGAPMVSSITASGSSPNNASSEQFVVTFSESVTGVAAGDFTLTTTNTPGGTALATTGISSITGSGSSYTVTVSGVTGDGTLRLDLNANSSGITDASGIGATAGFTGGDVYTIEHTPPSVASITATGASHNNAASEQYLVAFSENVTGVVGSDFTATAGGTVTDTGISVTAVSASAYLVTVNGVAGDGTLRLDLKSSGTGITDTAGNAISAGFTGGDVYAVDHTPPSASSITTAGVNPSNAAAETFTVTFSESVTGVTSADFTAASTGTVADTGITVTPVTGSVYTVTVNGVAGDGTLGLNLNASGTGITDTAGNAIAGGATGQVYTIEHTPPVVSSVTALGSSPNNANSEQFVVTFSESVTGVAAADFTLTTTDTSGGSALSTGGISSIVGSGTTYTVTVGSVVGDGTLRLDLKPNSSGITDAAGNGASAGFTGGDVYTIDHTAPGAPTVVLAHDTGTSNTDGITSDPTITVTPAESGGTLLYKIDGATSFSATAPNFATNGSADGVHTVTVEQQDAAGNIGAPTTLSFTLDTIAPAAPMNEVSLVHATGVAGTHNLTSDPTIVYGTPAAGDYFLYKVDNGSFSTTVPPTFATDHSADGLHTISLEEVDTAGNISAPEILTFKLDTIAPQITAVTASPSSGLESAGQTIDITVAFGEAVTVAGGTPTLSLNDNGTATYDAAATAALQDPIKLVFDYAIGVNDAITSPLAVTGINLHGAVIEDLASNVANLSNIATTFTGLGIENSLITANPDTNHVVVGQVVSADAAHGVLANDTDSNPAGHLMVSAVDGLPGDVNQSIAGAYGTLTMDADGSYSYSASGAASGVAFDNFTYTASNGHSPTSTSTLTVEVIGANQNFVFVPSGGSATGGYGNTVLDGSAGNATLTAATTFNAHQILIGGPGDVLNAASFGQDTFVFANNFGHDTINNFHPALDVIQLQASQFGSLAAVMADIQQVGADSVLALDANHVITIANTSHASLTAADFHLV